MKTTTEIVREVGQGLTRDHVRTLVRRDFLRPRGRSNRRGHPSKFSDQDVDRVRRAWMLRREGYTWDEACRRADCGEGN